ncbi:hypothetical protein PT974_00785 [Cladobotryum mycophilum]|uniref:Uncharacterized protein n=1 Tax=Cladobotryum mycophilum TaxID=491253 RepID=A0ABR0T348_9HYPO
MCLPEKDPHLIEIGMEIDKLVKQVMVIDQGPNGEKWPTRFFTNATARYYRVAAPFVADLPQPFRDIVRYSSIQDTQNVSEGSSVLTELMEQLDECLWEFQRIHELVEEKEKPAQHISLDMPPSLTEHMSPVRNCARPWAQIQDELDGIEKALGEDARLSEKQKDGIRQARCDQIILHIPQREQNIDHALEAIDLYARCAQKRIKRFTKIYHRTRKTS